MAQNPLGPTRVSTCCPRSSSVAAFTHYPLAIAFVVVGELIDRVEFYLELDFAQPSTQMRADLERAMV